MLYKKGVCYNRDIGLPEWSFMTMFRRVKIGPGGRFAAGTE